MKYFHRNIVQTKPRVIYPGAHTQRPTKLIFKQTISSKNIHADGTYKIIWQSFPVLMDAKKSNRLLQIAYSNNKKLL